MANVSHPLREILLGVSPESCPNILNFHCHTICSDGSLEPELLIAQASERGLQHIAVTDHHSTQAHYPMNEWLARRSDQGLPVPRLWSGLEISCLLKGCLVHVLALGFEVGHPALHAYCQNHSATGGSLQAKAVKEAIHEAGGLAVLAHPARYRVRHTLLIEAAAELGFDGGEAWYDYDFQTNWHPTPLICEEIDHQLQGLGLMRTCGTDTHGFDLSGR